MSHDHQDAGDTYDTHDTPDRVYKDDPADFGQSSETVQGRTSDRSGGEGPGEPADAATRPKGSQADWQHANDDRPSSEGVESRSADPGQGSYGGFRNEGPATPDGHPKADGDHPR